MEELPSYTRDTIHVLQMIGRLHIEGHITLVAIDVEALYSSIPHDKGISAIQHTLRPQSHLDPQFANFILASLDFVLIHNYFHFSGSHYLRVKGVAMGTCCAPSYANHLPGEMGTISIHC